MIGGVRVRRAIITGLVLLLLASCSGAGDPIRIGVAGNFGNVNIEPMRYGARLAVAEINAAGGIHGRSIELVERDDKENTDSAVVVATQLYEAGVVAVVGHGFSGLTLAAAPVYNGGSDPVVQISPTASSPAITQAGLYTFRMCPSDLSHGGALARWARDGLGFRRGAVLYGNDDYGRGVRQAFTKEFLQLGGEVTEIDPYLGSPPEVGPYLDRIARQGSSYQPQFLIVAGYLEDGEHILAEAHSRGVTLPIMGGDGLERIERAGEIAEGTYVTAAYLALIQTPKNRAFIEAWRKAYPDKAPPNMAAAGSYDAVYMLRDVINDVGTDRAAIRDAVAQIGAARPAFEGVVGTIAYDEHGDVTNPNVYIGVVRNGAVALAGGGQ